jgi:hypothetical protein
MKASGEARTQAFARRLIAGGYQGLLVRSFARGATGDDLNLVLWNGAMRPRPPDFDRRREPPVEIAAYAAI